MSHPFRCAAAAAFLCFCASTASAAHYKVYLLGGQSNMDGRAPVSGLTTTAADQAVQDQIPFYYLNNGPLTTLKPLTSGNQFGPEITFGRAMASNHPTDKFAFIKYTRGGTSLATNWKPGSGTDYNNFKTTVANGRAALTAAGHTYEIAGMLWLQGESDAGADATNYRTNIGNFIADMRSNYGANMPFVMGGIGYQTADYPIVSAALENAAQTIPNAAYFSNYDLLGPNHTLLHFDAPGVMEIGRRFATTVDSVPEPGSMAVVVAGLVGLLGVRRKRRA